MNRLLIMNMKIQQVKTKNYLKVNRVNYRRNSISELHVILLIKPGNVHMKSKSISVKIFHTFQVIAEFSK